MCGQATPRLCWCGASKADVVQVWNENRLTGVVGTFHVQGSHWDRVRRRFVASPGPISSLWAAVAPRDIATMNRVVARLQDAGLQVTERFAVLQNATGDVDLLDADGDVRLLLQSGEADVLTVAPVLRLPGCGVAGEVAAGVIGLSNMLNGGASVVALRRTKTAALEVDMLGEGSFVMYASEAPVRVDVDGVHLLANEEHGWKYNGTTLTIDVASSNLQRGVRHTVLVVFDGQKQVE